MERLSLRLTQITLDECSDIPCVNSTEDSSEDVEMSPGRSRSSENSPNKERSMEGRKASPEEAEAAHSPTRDNLTEVFEEDLGTISENSSVNTDNFMDENLISGEGALAEKIEEFNVSLARSDLRLKTFQDMGNLYRLYPGSYYDHDKCGWFCRKCQSYASPSSFSNPWISSGVQLGDHPTRKMKSHFESELHKRSLEAELALKKPSVYEMIQKYGSQTISQDIQRNRNALKSMFIIALYMVKHRLPNMSFEDMVNLIADAGSSNMRSYLDSCAKNATYTSRTTYTEILKTMNEYVEKPFLESLRKSLYTIFIDETTAVGNISVANVYVMYDDKNCIKEHYLGTINMNHGLGLTALHFHNAIVELAQKKDIDLRYCAFSELDGCSTNQGRKKGLKLYFTFYNPHHKSESCMSHKTALLPQHLVVEGEYQALRDADKLVVAIALFFKSSSLRSAVFDNTQLVLEVKALKLFIPCPARWLTHEKSF